MYLQCMEKSGYINSRVVLGDGSFATVFKGYDKSTGESVAIKQPKNVRQGQVLRKEIDILKKLPKHPNIIQVLDRMLFTLFCCLIAFIVFYNAFSILL